MCNVALRGGAAAAGWYGLRCGECARRAVTPPAARALPRWPAAAPGTTWVAVPLFASPARPEMFCPELILILSDKIVDNMAESMDTSEILPDEDDRKLFVGGLPQVGFHHIACTGRLSFAGRQTGRHLGPFSNFWRDRQYQFEDGPSYWKIKVWTPIAATDSYS